MKAILVEDELNVRKGFIKLLQAFCPEVIIIAEAENVETALAVIEQFEFDLLFLDINLPDGSGFDVLHRSNKKKFSTIFVTAYDQYAIDAFKMCATDYLLKPVSPDRLKSAVDRFAQNRIPSNNSESLEVLQSRLDGDKFASQKIILRETNSLHIIGIPSILYCSAEGAYTTFTLSNERKITTSTHLKEYERLLTGYQFLRCHNSYLASLEHILEIRKEDGDVLVMTNGDHVPLSIRKRGLVVQALKDKFIS